MANMRTPYKASVTARATQLKPTQITARHAACIPRNGATRTQSTRLDASRGTGGSLGRVESSLWSNQRDSSRLTRSAVGGNETSFSGVISSSYNENRRGRRLGGERELPGSPC